ncbi:MAG: PfkB family carbohydrate kinase, partial [Burkholderiales bacterium]
MAKTLDVICIGRSSVDLYGQQVGGRLEDMGSFAKSVGGCPSNIAIGAARLGLKSAVLTRVGDEHMGRYIREQMAREGVAIDGILTDPKRLTALVILGVRDSDSFPLIFYRTDCADMALDERDVDPAFFARARAIVVTGTHFSTPTTAAAQRKAMRIAREAGAKIVFDIDYRPNLWGLAGHGAGESRYIASDRVSQHLQPILPDCDLIVGTEEEVKIAGGADVVLIDEVRWHLKHVVAHIAELRAVGHTSALVVVAEAAGHSDEAADADSEAPYHGVGEWLARRLSKATGAEARATVLGHVQRGAMPTAEDRLLASALGVRAVDLLAEGKADRMVAWWNRQVIDVPLEKVVGRGARTVD